MIGAMGDVPPLVVVPMKIIFPVVVVATHVIVIPVTPVTLLQVIVGVAAAMLFRPDTAPIFTRLVTEP